MSFAAGMTALAMTGCQRKEKKAPEENAFWDEIPQEVDWKNVNTSFWFTSHPRVTYWRRRYDKTRDPWKLWQRAERYLPTIRKEFSSKSLPLELCLLPMIESSFDPLARSKRAAGMWQFIAPTAIDMGLLVNTRVDERLDWDKSTVAAAKYLVQLARKFDGDWGLVLAAYNVGPGALDRAIQEQGTRNFWELKLREETTEYVPKFLAMVQLLRESFPEA